MAIFATFQILLILRVLCVFSGFFNRTTQCDYWFFVSTLYSILFLILLARHRKNKPQKNYRWAQENGRFCFFQNVCMKKLRVFCVNMHCNLQYGSQNKLNYRSQT